MASEREEEATPEMRDERADAADREAVERDRAAEARDRAADEREREADSALLHRSGPDSASDRQASSGNRRAAARDRAHARQDRERAAADRDGARVREREQRLAAEVFGQFQRMLLPNLEPSLPVTSVHRPGDDRLLLGGDFLDCVRLADGSLRFIVGDVSGHGPIPAGVAVALRVAWRTLALSAIGVDETLHRMEQTLLSDPAIGELFATACCGALLPGNELCFASAGHPAPIALGSPPRALVGSVGPPLGIANGGRFPVVKARLAAAGALIYTDGLTEGRISPGNPQRVGPEGLMRMIAEVDLAGHPERLSRLVEIISERSGGLSDDAAALLIAPPLAEQPSVAELD